MSTLYLVATPIGNLSDLSPRAREVLSTVDFIAAEDTRVTQKLLNACELPKKPMISYYEHNRRARGEAVLEKLLAGETCALVTDAGTPAVSDPGEDLVALCAEHDIPVIPVPGCCAAVCALAASGLPTGRWCFEGFLSVNKKARREHLDALEGEKRTMIFYEAPHKLCATLRDLAAAFGEERRLSLSRELTKLHEQTLRMTLGEAMRYFDENAPRGEFVLIVEGAPDEPETEQDEAERLASAAKAVRRRVEQALREVHAEALADKMTHHLSGGEKRAVSIATVLSMSPDILVLDEPSANLDPASRRTLISLLRQFTHTKIIATHDLDMVMDLCTRCIVMKDGSILADAPVPDIFADRSLLEEARLEQPLSYLLMRQERQRNNSGAS